MKCEVLQQVVRLSDRVVHWGVAGEDAGGWGGEGQT